MSSSAWQKSSHSGASDNCVEVRSTDGLLEVRESDEADVIVRTTRLNLGAFLQGAKAGEFDHLTTNPKRIVPAASCLPQEAADN
ncbi:DUF397 domain-containing protein [Kitasatospora sp. NPDC056783]|uniref:DUF397 domain-containing protein n=1 Tax=Kitasatospora sp. NPDC056783 TaxID=3345943 RepID=UPI0036C3EC5C